MAIRWSGLVHSRRHRWIAAICLFFCLVLTGIWHASDVVSVAPLQLVDNLEEPVQAVDVEPVIEVEEEEPAAQVAFRYNTSLDDRLYRQVPLQIPNLRQVHHLPTRLADVPILPQPCLGDWLRHGRLTDPSCRTAAKDSVDVVWTWLNGSDPEWAVHNARWSAFSEIGRDQRPPARHYRDHGELRYSLRSMRRFMPAEGLGKMVLVAGDWEAVDRESMRVGQRPEWLRETEGDRRIDVVSHSEIWSSFEQPVQNSLDLVLENREEVLATRLPTFNSFSIESNLFNVQNLGPNIVYMNDDFFLVSPHSLADFHSPASIFGPIVSFVFSETNYIWPPPMPRRPWSFWDDIEPQVLPQPGFVKPVQNIAVSCNHEWSALSRSNYILSQRFGTKWRPVLTHFAKTFSKGIMQEVAIIWRDELRKSTRRRFREDALHLPGDYHASFLAQNLIVERAREAMLWTWAVAKLGYKDGHTGSWGLKEFLILRDVLRITQLEEAGKATTSLLEPLSARRVRAVTIFPEDLVIRRTLHPQHIKQSFEALGADLPLSNTYGWSSLDGPAPPNGATIRNCTLNMNQCFGPWWRKSHDRMKSGGATVGAVEMFKRLAFEMPECGDCLLSALIHHSGQLGMSTILLDEATPVPVRPRVPDPAQPTGQPYLPLTAEWKYTDFAVEHVVTTRNSRNTEVDLRDWTERLIARYTWTAIANSTGYFAMLRSARDVANTTARLDAHPPSIVALNDDFDSFSHDPLARVDTEAADQLMREWMQRKWPEKAPWEREED